MDIVLDGVDIFDVLLGGVGIVHPQVAQAAEFLRRAEINAQSLAVADVQIAVGLRRKAGVDRHPGKLAAGGNILRNKGMNEIHGFVFRQLFRHTWPSCILA